MPIYELQCPECGDIMEVLVIKTTDVRRGYCVKCQKEMQRVISECSFRLKGTGWAFDGYEDRPWGKKPYHKAVKEDGYVPGSFVETGKAQFKEKDD